MNKSTIQIILLITFLFTSCSTSQQLITYQNVTEKPALDLHESIPVDPGVRIGKLDNGMIYYIKKNLKPEKRAELRLVVKAGSVLEDNDQLGLAHFAEHMAFNGTKNFEKQELVDYLESIGMRFGPELNAYTGFDETVYMLQVPTDSVQIVEKAFQVMEDWAHNVSYDDEEIDKERGVIIEEWRGGRGAQARMRDKQLPILFKDSRYAERMPIGKMEIIENFPHETIRRFYRDWYRPDLMAVIAAGDFDRDWIENLIKKHFSGIKPVDNPREHTVYPVPGHDETLFAIATDPEATGSSVSIYYKHDIKPHKTINDYRRMLVDGIYNSMLNQRFYELTKLPEPPFLYGYSSKGRFIRSREFYVLGAGVKDNGIDLGLETLLAEAERVRIHGFTQSELDRQKKEMLRTIERIYNERDKTESQIYVSEYTRNFLLEESMPGIEYEYELYKKYVPGITLDEINDLAGKWIIGRNRVIMVNAPEKSGVTVPAQEDLLAIFDNVSKKDIQPYVDTFIDKPLIADSLNPIPFTEEKEIEDLGVTELRFSNGIRVILKPTDFKNDEVLFTSFSPGGHSLVPDENYIAASTASSVIAESGVGDYNRIELNKFLSGKIVSVSPWINSLQEGISGSASPEDIETMFQLIYLYFTSSRKDSTAFQSFKSRMKGIIENRGAQPETAFQDTVSVTMAQYHHRERPWTMELLEEMNLDISYEFYLNRFADSSDFTFFFVGNFEIYKLKPFIQRYLGNLPALNRSETWKDTGINAPKGIIKKAVYRGLEDKSLVRIIFTGPFTWTRQNRYDIQSMVSVLRIKLREVLREDLGGTYGVGVYSSLSHHPDEEYGITVSFGCDPERVAELITTVMNEIEDIKANGTTDVYLNKVKEAQRREYEVNLKGNSYWLSTLSFYYFHEENPLEILKLEKYIEKLSSEVVQKAAQQYFDMNNYVTVVLYPEKE